MFAKLTSKGWYLQLPLYEISIPSLHSAVVATMTPSTSMRAWSKKESSCCFQTLILASLMACIRESISDCLKRRQKSPAVVGFMIGCMRLQETDMIVDCIGQPDMLGKLEHGGNTSVIAARRHAPSYRGATDGQRNWPEMRKTLGKPLVLQRRGQEPNNLQIPWETSTTTPRATRNPTRAHCEDSHLT